MTTLLKNAGQLGSPASTRSRLRLLVLACLAPVVILAVVLYLGYYNHERERHSQAALDLAERVTQTIDREIETLRATMETLATSPAVAAGDLQSFDAQVRLVLRSRGDFIAMRERSGQQVLNSSRPFGSSLPISIDPMLREADDDVFRTGKSVVSDLYVGATVRRQFVLVDVPVFVDGAVRYALNMALEPGRLAGTLTAAAPAGWIVALVDRKDRIIARSSDHERFLGAEASASLRRYATGERATWSGVTLDGRTVLSAAVRSSTTGWRVSVGVPVEEVMRPLWSLMGLLVALGLGTLALSLWVASLAARSIERPLLALTKAAEHVGRDEKVSLPPLGLSEAATVGEALAKAQERILERDADLARAQRIGGLGRLTIDLRDGGFRNHRSPEYLAIHGLPPDAWNEKHEQWVARIHPEDREATERKFLNALATGERRYEVEYRIIRPSDGEVRWIRADCEIERDETGRPLRLLGVHRDITDRRQREAALIEGQTRLRTALDVADLGTWEANRVTGLSQWDDRMALLVGARPEQAQEFAQRWLEFMGPEDRERVSRLQMSVAVGESFTAEYQVTRLDGVKRIFLSRGTRMTESRIVGSVQEVTELRASERRQQELNQELEARVREAVAERQLWTDLIEAADAFIVVVDDSLRIVGLNRAARQEYERLYGTSPKAGDSILPRGAQRPDDGNDAAHLWRRALSGESFTMMEEIDDPARGKRHYEMTFSALHDDKGVRRWASRISYDVTEREVRRAELADAQAKLFETQKMETIGQLTGGVAHDFNNLLAAISANLELARKRAGADERLMKLLDGAMQGAQRGATLTKRLLAFARRQELKADSVDLRELIAGMQDLLARSLGPSIEIVLAFPPDLPAAKVDANQLELALLNLALNSRDAMPAGGTLSVRASVEPFSPDADPRRSGPFVRLCVTDTGGGMDSETLKRATEPFFTTKGIGKGTGLGLSMVQGLAAQSGGALRIDSAPGRGTEVCIWLPLADPRPQIETRPAAAADLPGIGGPLRVLVVDDDALVAMGTEAMLEDLGHVVEVANSGASALALYVKGAFDLVVTDHAMPGMTGMQLAQRLRSVRADQPIILASGYAELPVKDELSLPRLAKPFRQEELAAAIGAIALDRTPSENVVTFNPAAGRSPTGRR